MMYKIILSIIILFPVSFFTSQATAQTNAELENLKTIMHYTSAHVNYDYAGHNHNDLDMVFSGLFLFYKKFVSSQDYNHCVFTPSCSEYALQAIKKKGLLIGSLSAFDRLMRCNGLSREQYTIDTRSQLFIDPVH